MKLKFLIFFLTLPSLCFAKDGDWVNENTLDPQHVYEATAEACSQIEPKDMRGGLKFDRLYAGIFPSQEFNILVNSIQQEALLKSTIYVNENQRNENNLLLTQSEGYKYALNECFKEKEDQKRFTWLVKRRVKAGRSLGLAISFAAFAKAFSAVSKISKVTGKVMNYSTLSFIAGKVSYSAYKKSVDERRLKRLCGKFITKECAFRFFAEVEQQ